MNVWLIVAITAIVCVVGGGGAYLLWLMTRPKKMTWNCRIYQRAAGVRPPLLDKRGNVISDLKLSDLRPYAMDIIERIEKKPGITLYRLQKLNKVTPAVSGDVVDYWGHNKKEVWALLEGDTVTLLNKGYNRDTGDVILEPLAHDRATMIKGEMAIRKDRLQETKDILQAITPWIVTGIAMLGLVALAYFLVQGFIEISTNYVDATQNIEEATNKLSETLIKVATIGTGGTISDENLEAVGLEREEPPSVEG